MEPVTIRLCQACEIYNAPNAAVLWDEYAREAMPAELSYHAPQVEAYERLYQAGVLHPFGAFRGDELVGVLAMIVTQVPHYDRPIATTESFFVCADARKGGAGTGLLKAAENHAKALGARALFISAPANSRLDLILPKVGYRLSNHIFVRGLV